MYLFKSRHSVYFIRVCTPKALTEQGFPFDFKFSLQTKSRSIAIRRSAPILSHVLQSLDKIDITRDSPATFKSEITSSVQIFRNAFNDTGIEHELLSSDPLGQSQKPKNSNNNYVIGYRWQEQFIETKRKAKVTHLTVHQLDKRTRYFLDHLKKSKTSITQINARILMAFGNHLQSWDKSAKTKKDYWGSAKQFVKWLVINDFLSKNSFDGLSLTFKSDKFASEQREKWSKTQVETFLKCDQFQRATPSMRWSVLLLIYMGLRPSEVCQLAIVDIQIKSEMLVLTITDKGESQKLKNQHSLRTLPVHNALIQLGFLDFVREQKRQNQINLFNWTPTGPDQDWTKLFRTQFAKIQNALAMKSGARPTAYGFRHTFIDDLKQKGIEEYQVAEVVGHANHNMTYGRYGKKLTLPKLKAVIDIFSIHDH
ncbi:hypothetical protein A9264_15910 [Vibrio sp. UCD-FRSSP16_10]|uniref:site-specific integrase n=1 Tax=unclassified Vibrio TaxID=2614977 RepID=UPI0007FE2CB5|nr:MULTISPECIES: site-specific integrase [unclassified Vibrio]OBT12740.1 hypothetical protein A9260_15835 [Vibrio sp. UCD-FRSSP16_30]OBT18207.1 hypothetical protein A9264_15910 [Vibrio sp. UCD-FRSSP16_10]